MEERPLKAGDPLRALKQIAFRDDAPTLTLRGIAMAQLGEFAKAKVLSRRGALVRRERAGMAYTTPL